MPTCQQHTPVISGAPATRMQQMRYIADNYDPKYTTVVTVAELRLFMEMYEAANTLDGRRLGETLIEASNLMGEVK